jgi:hypothetical protein
MTDPMNQAPPLPQPVGADPSDPENVLRVFLARYFRPGLVDSYIRTFVPAGLGFLLSWLALNFRWLHLPEHPSATFSATVTVLAIGGYYFVARLVEKRWPALGKWLVALNLTQTAPVYVKPVAAPAVEAAAAATPEQVVVRHASGGN